MRSRKKFIIFSRAGESAMFDKNEFFSFFFNEQNQEGLFDQNFLDFGSWSQNSLKVDHEGGTYKILDVQLKYGHLCRKNCFRTPLTHIIINSKAECCLCFP